jgi:paired amphipathic helix protein Sin3a
MCWDVLNDEWVSHPTSLSEDAPPFVAHKKNMYEDALHRAEEERHEYDYHIEANLRTIALLEPIASRIQTMSPEEKQGFRLKPGLGGQSKSIYQRIIKKIYGKDAGLEVIGALHDNPTVAVPVVLARLKLKDEEWKKAQREWNKVWREVDAKNFYKSLDHQGVSFKANDKKAITTKSLISEIEALRREQVQRREALLDPTLSFRNKFQYSYTIEDTAVLQDCLKLVFSYLDRAPGGLSTRDREGVEAFLREFVPTFFLFDRDEFDLAFEIPNLSGGSGDGESDVDGMSDAASGMGEEEDDNSSASARKLKKAAGDLRKKLLKGAVTPSANGRGRDSPSATPGPSSVPAVAAVAPAVTPVADDAMAVDTPEPEAAAAATGGAAPATPAATEATETSASSAEVTTTAEQLAAASTEGIVSTTIAEGAVAGTALTPVSSAAAAEDSNGMAVDPSPKAASSTDPTVPGTAPVGPSSSSSTAAPVANDGGASTWIAMQESVASPADPNGVAASRSASVAAAEAATNGETKDAKPAAPRKINMFANSPIYCLFRLLQVSRAVMR